MPPHLGAGHICVGAPRSKVLDLQSSSTIISDQIFYYKYNEMKFLSTSNIEKLCEPRPRRTGLPTPKAKGDRKAEGLCGARVLFSNRTVDLYIKKIAKFRKVRTEKQSGTGTSARVHATYIRVCRRAGALPSPFYFWFAFSFRSASMAI